MEVHWPLSSSSQISLTSTNGGHMNGRFSRKTFEYFEGAAKNRKNLRWFMNNRSLYEEEVKLPFTVLLNKVSIDVKDNFQGISFDPRKISLPTYRTENIPEDGTIVKPFTWAFLSEKKTSLFEWNPGINISIGQEISLGMGLFHPSSRQMKILREEIMNEPSALTRILKNKKLSSTWGELSGEKYVRFPKEYSEEAPGGEFLWHKQMIVTQSLSRKEVISPGFADRIAEDLNAGAGFLSWLRGAVGVYERSVPLEKNLRPVHHSR